jgi:hypothetical protein
MIAVPLAGHWPGWRGVNQGHLGPPGTPGQRTWQP